MTVAFGGLSAAISFENTPGSEAGTCVVGADDTGPVIW